MDKLIFHVKNRCWLYLSMFAVALVPQIGNAAYIYFEPSQITKSVGENISVTVRLNTEGQNINAVDVTLSYPGLLRVTGISKSGSGIQLWVQDPSYTNSTVTITGGVPGGITSSNMILARITFQAAAVGDGSIGLSGGSSVLLNDGQGNQASLRLVSNVLHITPRSATSASPISTKPTNSQLPSVSVQPSPLESGPQGGDTEKPKKFSIMVGSDPRVFGGKQFISFFTTDTDTGVDRYEVREGSGSYKIAQAPYLLSDQELKTVVRVRAYDAAGNFREATYPGFLKRFWLWIMSFF